MLYEFQAPLDLEFDVHEPVTLYLSEGSGPVSIIGKQQITYSIATDDEIDESDYSYDYEEEEELIDEGEELVEEGEELDDDDGEEEISDEESDEVTDEEEDIITSKKRKVSEWCPSKNMI